MKGAVGGLHDLGFGVGEVALRRRLGLERVAPVARRAGLLALRGELGAARGLAPRAPRPPAPALASRIVASRCSRRCSSSGSSSPRRSGPKRASSSASTRSASASSASTFARSAAISASSSRLLVDHPLVAHRLVARGVRAQLGAVERERPQPDQLGLAGTAAAPARTAPPAPPGAARGTGRSSGSRGADRRTASAPRRRDSVARLELARGHHAVRVAVDQQLDHQPRVIRRIAALVLVGGVDRRQIQRAGLDQIGDEVRQIALRAATPDSTGAINST